MSKRVVDTLEFIDIDVQDRYSLAALYALECPLELLTKKYPVWQVGQRVVVRQMSDPLIKPSAFGNILLRGKPAPIGERIVYNQDCATVCGLQDGTNNLFLRHVAQDIGAKLVHVALEGARLLPMCDEVPEAAARLCHVRREPV